MTERLENKIENFNNALNRLGEMCVKFRNSKDKEEKKLAGTRLFSALNLPLSLVGKLFTNI